jgi:hypothetical protein
LNNQKSTLKKSEKYIIIIMLVVATVMYTYHNFQMRSLDDNPVYVIGHLTKAESGGDSGWYFNFEYTYNNKTYKALINGPIGESAVKDSLMYFRISADKPSLSEPVLQQWVPPCVAEKGQPLLGWKEVPYCK